MKKLKKKLSEVNEQNKDIVRLCSDERVFKVEYISGKLQLDGVPKLYIIEGCDNYYGICLTKETCVKLANYFSELADIV